LSVAATALQYRSQPDTATYGDYSFKYPPHLLVLQDYVYKSAAASAHVVVLRHKDAEDGDLRSIEINMLRSLEQRRTCNDYSVCATVEGVVIGTNSEDPEFGEAFKTVVGSFRHAR
jgi:hypothetical protein